MFITNPSANGRTRAATELLSDLIVRLRSNKPDDASLFGLFADLAREVGRDDLHTEFTRRAAAAATPPSTPHTYSPVWYKNVDHRQTAVGMGVWRGQRSKRLSQKWMMYAEQHP